jgi:hypothetical protein
MRAVGEDPLRQLLSQVHLARAEDLPMMLQQVAPGVGARLLTPYLVDYTQRLLVPLQPCAHPAAESLTIDGTLAGRAYRTVTVQRSTAEDVRRVWVPLLDGTERLGVLEAVVLEEPDDEAVGELLSLAGLFAELLTTRSAYGDAVERTRRRQPMSLAAELQWGLLPPLTYATPDLVVAAVLEPCYDIGGDSFDYAVNDATLHVGLFDAVGHGIEAAQLVALAMAAYRSARRTGLDLADTATSVDRWISQQFPDTFVTGVLLELESQSGELRTVNAGHPSPLVFRAARHVRTLPGPTRFPFGLGRYGPGSVAVEVLEHGDRVLLYSDGIVEARRPDGQEFGLELLVDFVGRQLAAELPAPETMRRLVHQILEHQQDALQDDATAVLVEWAREGSERILP